MNTSFIILSILTFLLPFGKEYSRIKNEPNISVKATILGYYNFVTNDNLVNLENDNFNYYLVNVNLTNNSGSELEFLTSSCTTVGNITFDQKFIVVCVNKCINNQITTIRLKPKQVFTVSVILRSNKEYSNRRVKIGWILLTYKNVDSPNKYYEILEKCRSTGENVIWSDPIELQYYMQHPYEIKN